MPIKPENRARYPKDWPMLSLAARQRARWRCQHPGCTALQYAVGCWDLDDAGVWRWGPVEGNTPPKTAQDHEFDNAGEGCDFQGDRWTYKAARAFIDRYWGPEEDRPIVIVLTVAHLNHQPEDCRPENLAAMCQRHHLAYDAHHHKQTAYATRKRAALTADLFDA